MNRVDEFRPGQVLSAGALNAILGELARLGKISTVAPMTHFDEPGGICFFVSLPPEYWIRLTGGGPGGKYAWERVIPGAGGTWTAAAGNQQGTTTNDPAYESNLNASVNLSPAPVVRAWRDPVSNTIIFTAGTC